MGCNGQPLTLAVVQPQHQHGGMLQDKDRQVSMNVHIQGPRLYRPIRDTCNIDKINRFIDMRWVEDIR
jgi:hypothetical protein